MKINVIWRKFVGDILITSYLVNNWILFRSIIMFYLVYFTNYFHVPTNFGEGGRDLMHSSMEYQSSMAH
jgi:hypothetical protein